MDQYLSRYTVLERKRLRRREQAGLRWDRFLGMRIVDLMEGLRQVRP